jgi:hypothetical protein
MRFGTWNISSLYGSGSLKTVAKELAKYGLDLIGVEEVRWDISVKNSRGLHFCGKQNENYRSGTGFFAHKRIISAFKRVQFA